MTLQPIQRRPIPLVTSYPQKSPALCYRQQSNGAQVTLLEKLVVFSVWHGKFKVDALKLLLHVVTSESEYFFITAVNKIILRPALSSLNPIEYVEDHITRSNPCGTRHGARLFQDLRELQ